MKSYLKYSFLLGFHVFVFGCDTGPVAYSDDVLFSDDTDLETTTKKRFDHVITQDTLILNPTGYTPLSAELKLETSQPVQIELEIVSPYDGEENLIHRFDETGTSFTLPVLGLYPSHNNALLIRLYDRANQFLGQETRWIDTPQLISGLPTISVIVNTGRQKPGMNLVSYTGHSNSSVARIPFMFDQYGHIRWYATMETHPTLNRLNYDVGVERLQNGHLYFGDINTRHIYELDMLGRVINDWPLPGYDFHHHVLELPSGNFLVTATKLELPTVEDHVIEIDRETGTIVTQWDLRESLDSRRRTWTGNPRDWFHANGLTYDEDQDAIIVSGRYQGVVKLTRTNEVVWILAPHRDWELSGNGTDLKRKLLQPVDSNGRPITDLRVVTGYSDHSEFAWAWLQHAPKLTPQGTLFVFDNGIGRTSSLAKFSRAVEYRIDDEAMTIQQVWEYGRERGRSTYAPAVSDVDFHPDENTVVFMPGTNQEYVHNGKTIEVDYTTRDVVYEAMITKGSYEYFIFHRIERIPIYPPNQ